MRKHIKCSRWCRTNALSGSTLPNRKPCNTHCDEVHRRRTSTGSSPLGFGLVPPTVERVLQGRTGSLQLWVEGSMTEWDRKQRGILEKGEAAVLYSRQGPSAFAPAPAILPPGPARGRYAGLNASQSRFPH